MGRHGIETLTDVEVNLVTIFMIVKFIFSGVVASMHSCIWRPLCYRNEPVFVAIRTLHMPSSPLDRFNVWFLLV